MGKKISSCSKSDSSQVSEMPERKKNSFKKRNTMEIHKEILRSTLKNEELIPEAQVESNGQDQITEPQDRQNCGTYVMYAEDYPQILEKHAQIKMVIPVVEKIIIEKQIDQIMPRKKIIGPSMFVQHYRRSQNMMNRSFLQFLNFKELFHLSMTCQTLRTIIDSNDPNKYHLSQVAAIQFLKKDNLSPEDIIIELNVRVGKTSDFLDIYSSKFRMAHHFLDAAKQSLYSLTDENLKNLMNTAQIPLTFKDLQLMYAVFHLLRYEHPLVPEQHQWYVNSQNPLFICKKILQWNFKKFLEAVPLRTQMGFIKEENFELAQIELKKFSSQDILDSNKNNVISGLMTWINNIVGYYEATKDLVRDLQILTKEQRLKFYTDKGLIMVSQF